MRELEIVCGELEIIGVPILPRFTLETRQAELSCGVRQCHTKETLSGPWGKHPNVTMEALVDLYQVRLGGGNLDHVSGLLL